MKPYIALLLLLVAFAFSSPLRAATEKRDFVVIIDPGHGGKDHGAVGRLTNEKSINLKVGLEVRRLLKDIPGISVIMTRSDDRFIELQERANIANRNHGDLFVSIHVNSVANSNPNRTRISGASVYALGLHRSESNLAVAKRENSVMELEPDYTTRYQGFDPNSTESYIIFELSQNKHLNQSIRFAEMAESQLCATAGRRNRGVLQAGFWVLHASAMPAVLVELDFICNPTVEQFLASKDGIARMGRSIADAISSYAGVKAPEADKQADPRQPVITIDPCPEQTEAPAEMSPEEHQTTWRVQFMATDRSLPVGAHQFKGLEKVEEYFHNGSYKYTAGGHFASEADAERYAATVVRKKFPQAFVIAWKDGKRI